MQRGAVRLGQSALDNGMKLGKLGFKLFVHQQQRLQGAAKVAVTAGDNFVDGGLV